MPNTAGRPRLGLVVAKKITRSAVQRNYMKRVLRELFRQNRARLGNLDLVIRPQKTFGPALYQQVRTEFEQALVRLAGRGQAGAA